jgi:hypothetical protein
MSIDVEGTRPLVEATETVAEWAEIPDQFPDAELIVAELQDRDTAPSLFRRACVGAGRAAIATGMVGVAATTSVLWLEYGLGSKTQVAGFDATIHPRIGQSFSYIDFGAAGSGTSDKHKQIAGIDIGINVRVQGNHLDLKDKATRAEIGQIGSHPDPEIDRVVSEAKKTALEQGLLVFGGALLLEAEVVSYRLRRRKHFGTEATNLTDNQRQVLRSESQRYYAKRAIAAAAVVGLVTYPIVHPRHKAILADPILDGTPVQGLELDGPIDQIASIIKSAYESTGKFDDETNQNLKYAIGERPYLQPRDGWVSFVEADDLQDNDGQARQFGTLIRETHANFGNMSGDWSSITQLGIGSHIMDTVRSESNHALVLSEKGDHDDEQTEEYAKTSDITMGDNKARTIDGVSILPLNSVDVSSINTAGGYSSPRDSAVDTDKAVANAVKEISENHVTFAFVHDKDEGAMLTQAVAKSGYDAPLVVIDGRSYNYVGPQRVSSVSPLYNFTMGSSGGHTSTDFDPGPIHKPTIITWWAYNPSTGEVMYAPITFNPNATVSIPEHPSVLIHSSSDSEVSANASSTDRVKNQD